MERRRVSCNRMLDFGGTKNPCHKILCDIVAKEVIQIEDKILIKGFREIRLKCSSCRQITKIINEECDVVAELSDS